MNMQQSGGQSHDHEGSLLTCKPLVSEQGRVCSSARELEVRSAVRLCRNLGAQLHSCVGWGKESGCLVLHSYFSKGTLT